MYMSLLEILLLIKSILPSQLFNHVAKIMCNFTYFIAKESHKSRKSIVIIGDSHVNFFSGNECLNWYPISRYSGGINKCRNHNKNVDAIHLGPALAYSLNRYGSTTRAREKIDILRKSYFQKHDNIICVFGEIDIRVHVLRQAEINHVDYFTVIDNIVENYVNFMSILRDDGYNVWCWGPIASQKDSWNINLEYPRYGTEVMRNLATEYFNNKLEMVCNEKNIGFVTIFPDLITKEYQTKYEYISDECHLSQKAWEFAIPKFRKAGLSKIFENLSIKNDSSQCNK